MKKKMLFTAAGAALAIMAGGAMAQTWPAKPITLVVPYTCLLYTSPSPRDS